MPEKIYGSVREPDVYSSGGAALIGTRTNVAHPMASLDVSVLVCTYNRAGLLAQTLGHIAAQAISPQCRWELLVIDNNCTDQTLDVVRKYADDSRIPTLRFIREPQQGIAHARRRAFLEARGNLLVSVDDDCLLEPNWVEQAIQFAGENPNVGMFGGRHVIVWERPPNRVADLYANSLARQDLGNQRLCLSSKDRTCLVGAAFVLRREAIVASGWLESGVLVGRCGEYLGAGEDAEIFYRVRHAGWECWYVPQLVLSHVVPVDRTTLPYLRRLHQGFGEAEPFLLSLSRSAHPTFFDRVAVVGWTFGEITRVLARWPKGYVCSSGERPTWLIRMSHAMGCLAGALRYLITGRA